MTIKIGINGFGRMGRLAFRALWGADNVDIIRINDPAGDAKTLAHLINFDSVHGRWKRLAEHEGDQMTVANERIICTQKK